jgi:hypothetical protein
LVILVPLVFTAQGILATASAESTAQDVVADWIGDDSRLRVGQVSVTGSTVSVDVTGAGALPSPKDLQSDLSEALGTPVEVVIEFTPSAEITVSQSGSVRRDEGSTSGR